MMKSFTVALLLTLALVSPSMAASPDDEILAVEKASWKAWAAHDSKAYGDTMTDDAVVVAEGIAVQVGKQQIATDHSCKSKSYELTNTKVRKLSPDVAILTYNLAQDVTCEGVKLPPKIFATSIYVRQNGKWRWTHYQETTQP